MIAELLSDILVPAVAEGEEHPDQTLFYVIGGVLAAWALVVTAIGLTRPSFPSSRGQRGGVIALTALLMAGAVVSAVVTA